MKKHSRIYAEINLDAIEKNFEHMKEHIHPFTKIISVIKADGYGHGAVPIAQMIEEKTYIWGFAVATAEEALELREHSIHKPILVLGYTFEEHYEKMIQENICLTVFQLDMAQKLSQKAVQMGKTISVHLAVDTGMSRIGFPDTQESIPMIWKIFNLPGIKIEGIFTHFAKADETDKSFSVNQLKRFLAFYSLLEEEQICIPICHCSNSAGILELPDANLSMVRAGISIYGIYPSNEVDRTQVMLEPAMSLRSHIIYIKEVEAGIPVSYGGTFVTKRNTRIATIPVGYGDGYPRSLSNKGYVLILGKKAPILGRICMDQFMVDVSEIPEAKELDEVVLMGRSKDALIGIDELGDLSNRFPYEFVCCVGKRIPRVYRKNGKLLNTL